ncbi:MAG: uroporphyrinogen-III synthase [Hyphomicrobiaceae bacterium]
MHILITRPEPDASDWRVKFEARGAKATVDPLLEIEFLPPQTADLSGIQALIATSRNALRGLQSSPMLTKATTLPLFTVGPATTKLARDLGFSTLHEGPASARDLVPLIRQRATPAAGPLLHLCGDKLAFDLGAALSPHGYTVPRLTVYRSCPATKLHRHTIAALASGSIDTVMLMSPLTAKTFANLAQQAGLNEQCQRLVYVCLSQNVSSALMPLKPATVHIAREPNSQAVFTLIETLLA